MGKHLVDIKADTMYKVTIKYINAPPLTIMATGAQLEEYVSSLYASFRGPLPNVSYDFGDSRNVAYAMLNPIGTILNYHGISSIDTTAVVPVAPKQIVGVKTTTSIIFDLSMIKPGTHLKLHNANNTILGTIHSVTDAIVVATYVDKLKVVEVYKGHTYNDVLIGIDAVTSGDITLEVLK